LDFSLYVSSIAEKSAPDNADGRHTLLENGVYDRLDALGSADGLLD